METPRYSRENREPALEPVQSRPNELRLCGVSAVRARFQKDPDSFKRLYFDYETGRKLGIMSKALAVGRKIYRCVETEELEILSGTVHHGGVVAVVSPPALDGVEASDTIKWAKRLDPILVLDSIGNAHNLGAIARTAAFFGVPRIVIPDHAGAAKPNDAAYRVAEGGLEHVEVRMVSSLPSFLLGLKEAGYAVIGTSVKKEAGKAPQTLEKISDKTKGKAVALILGNEERGLAPDIAAACSDLVMIPGQGTVESLNVSAAAAVLIWELMGSRASSRRR